jgi:hypothetical protein
VDWLVQSCLMEIDIAAVVRYEFHDGVISDGA